MAISILAVINAMLPKDRGSRRIAHDLPYGPDARQQLDIYAPKAASGPLPVVFFIYGGSWMDGSRHHYHFIGRALAALGYVVVIADYRVLPAVEYPTFLQDCAAAFAWTVDHIADYGGDPERMALMGHSAGAYNCLMLALDPAYLQARGLLERVKAVVGVSGPYDFFPFDGPISLRTFGAVCDPKATQPINLVASGMPPAWLGSGDKDTLVYPRNTVALSARLREAGGAIEEVHYPKLGHGGTLMAMARPLRGMAPVLADIAGFLEARLA